jgi:hypothetical protein
LKNDILLFGLILIIVGVFFTFITFGIGIICTWPLIFIGFILLVIGAIIPSRRVRDSFDYKTDFHKSRYCPSCEREIDFDAKFCSYCGREIKEY